MDDNGAVANVSADDFAALEGKVLQTVELIKREREARAVAESAGEQAQKELAAARHELEAMHQERNAVRKRVETMLASMDELLP